MELAQFCSLNTAEADKAEKPAQAKGKGRHNSSESRNFGCFVSVDGRLQDAHGTWWREEILF